MPLVEGPSPLASLVSSYFCFAAFLASFFSRFLIITFSLIFSSFYSITVLDLRLLFFLSSDTIYFEDKESVFLGATGGTASSEGRLGFYLRLFFDETVA